MRAFRCLAVMGHVVLLAAVTTAAPTVRDWSQGFASPALGGAGLEAAGRSFTCGHLTIAFRGGRLLPVVVGGAVVGAYFDGDATVAYTSTDPLEAAAYRTNADRSAGYTVDPKGTITDAVESVLILRSGGIEDLAGGQPWREGAPSAAAKAAFAGHLERFAEDRGMRYTQLMPQAIVDPPPAPVTMIEMQSGKHDLVYVYDTLRDGEESIAALWESGSDVSFFKNLRYPQLISEQPIGRGRLDAAPRRFALTALDLTLLNPGGLKAELTTRETFQAMAPVRVLDLGLWSRWAGTAGLGAKPAQNDYVLSKVTLAGGGAVPFAHVDGDLLVELPKPLAVGEKVVLDFEVAGDVLFRPGNDSYWEMPTSDWYPTPNRLDTQYMSYHAVVKVAKPFTAFSDGRTVRRWEEGDLACAEFREDKPIQIPVVLAGKYATESDEKTGVTVSVSSYAGANAMAAKKIINNTFALMEVYRPFLGDYPFSELKIIEINSYGFGQAPAGVIFITKEAFSPLEDETSRLFSQGINARLAHELAHTWWGHVAKLGAPQDQWLSESLAEYYSAYAISRVWRKSEYKRALGDWKLQSRYVKDHASILTANELSGPKAWEDRTALLYAKGPLVLDALRRELGDNAFFTICKSYLKTYDFKFAETRNFIGLTSFVAKKDMAPWFDRYLLGTDWPKD